MIGTLITIIIYCVVLGLIVWLLNYLIDVIPLAEPFARIARIVVIVLAVLIVIMLLLSLVDSGPLRFPRF
jgi:hypothetical protein